MAAATYLLLILASTVHGAPNKLLQKADEKQDLKTASSSYSHQYSDWRGRYPSGYDFSVIGYGTADDRAASNFGNLGGYNTVGYSGSPGLGGHPGFSAGPGYSAGYGGYNNKGYNGFEQGGYEGGYGGNVGYGRNGGYSDSAGTRGYGLINSGNGGYGGNGGNGGLTSYYGYKNPYYQENNHLGYGYYNKRPGYGSIYNSGITPSLVTGYRGYSR